MEFYPNTHAEIAEKVLRIRQVLPAGIETLTFNGKELSQFLLPFLDISFIERVMELFEDAPFPTEEEYETETTVEETLVRLRRTLPTLEIIWVFQGVLMGILDMIRKERDTLALNRQVLEDLPSEDNYRYVVNGSIERSRSRLRDLRAYSLEISGHVTRMRNILSNSSESTTVLQQEDPVESSTQVIDHGSDSAVPLQ